MPYKPKATRAKSEGVTHAQDAQWHMHRAPVWRHTKLRCPTHACLHLGAEEVHAPRVAVGLLQQLAAGRQGAGDRSRKGRVSGSLTVRQGACAEPQLTCSHHTAGGPSSRQITQHRQQQPQRQQQPEPPKLPQERSGSGAGKAAAAQRHPHLQNSCTLLTKALA